MTPATYVFGIVSALLVLVVVFELLRRRRVRERHALWWIFAGVLALVVAVFPQLLTATAELIGIRVPTNLSFFVSVIILFLVSVQHSAELTVLEDKTRTLAEHVALQDQRLTLLEGGPDAGRLPSRTTVHGEEDLPLRRVSSEQRPTDPVSAGPGLSSRADDETRTA